MLSFKDFITEVAGRMHYDTDEYRDKLRARMEVDAKMYKAQAERDARNRATQADREAIMKKSHEDNLKHIAKMKYTPDQIAQAARNHVATADDNKKRGWSND